MKTMATLAFVILLTSPLHAAVVHDESSNGDLSTNNAAPTALAFAPGTNTVIGSVLGGPDTRDYLTFTLPPGHFLMDIHLMAFAPDNLAFASLNTGATSFVPGAGTSSSFLSGIHVSGIHVGTDLLDAFVNESVTTFSLPSPMLGPGTYSFLIQQTTPLTSAYTLDFVVEAPVPAQAGTWGSIKKLYR